MIDLKRSIQKRLMTSKQAIALSSLWVGLSLLFNIGVFYVRGTKSGLEFLTGYLIEKALSTDNIFVFFLVFNSFSIPAPFHHRVLFWGIFGALIMRAGLIFSGIQIINFFPGAFYFFGVLLIYSAYRSYSSVESIKNIHASRFLNFFKKVFPISEELKGHHFFTRENKKLCATPLFVALVGIECIDLIFACDSIPAILAITLDPFIVYTSNIFAVLGLRAIYSLLLNLIPKFYYLRHALTILLGFIGMKMMVMDFYPVPILLSLGVTFFIILTAIAASIIKQRKLGRVTN